MIRWKTVSVYVDIDTGELLSNEKVLEQYNIIKKHKSTKVYENEGIVTITNECKRSGQLKLF